MKEDYKIPKLHKLELKTVEAKDITPIKVPKFTMEDYRKWQIEMLKRYCSQPTIIPPKEK